MKLTCLSKGDGFQYSTCHMLNLCGFRILINCPLDLLAITIFSPVPYDVGFEAFEYASDVPLDAQNPIQKKQKLERQLTLADLVCAEPWYKTLKALHLWEGKLSTNDEEEESDSSPSETDSEADELLQLDGKSISEWLSELDVISKEVESELVSRDIGCHLVQVVEAVNTVLFDLRGFNRKSILDLEPKYSYLHYVLNDRCGTAFLFSVIYMEVCKRIGVTIVGSKVGEEFLIWPQEMAKTYPEELLKVSLGT